MKFPLFFRDIAPSECAKLAAQQFVEKLLRGPSLRLRCSTYVLYDCASRHKLDPLATFFNELF
jgi:hypothetical protein